MKRKVLKRDLSRQHVMRAMEGVGAVFTSRVVTSAAASTLINDIKWDCDATQAFARARSMAARTLLELIDEGVLEVVREEIIRGVTIRTLKFRTDGDVTPTPKALKPYEETLRAFQEAAKRYLENKQFDKMGLA